MTTLEPSPSQYSESSQSQKIKESYLSKGSISKVAQTVKRNMPSDTKVRSPAHVRVQIFHYLLNDTLLHQ